LQSPHILTRVGYIPIKSNNKVIESIDNLLTKVQNPNKYLPSLEKILDEAKGIYYY
jgi:hypothetical protein